MPVVLRQFGFACLLFAGLTVVMTWPQARLFGTHAAPHHDVYFNMWRFGWVAHALATDPAALLDANIFHPERRTLTYSDAMPVEAAVAAPMLWVRVPPVAVHNIVLLLGIVLSGAGLFVLARELTGSRAAGVIAGIIFSFASYRFEHYMHMELQWTVWIPWAFWALHRASLRGAWRYGLLVGLFGTLQVLSSIYYGVFLWTLLGTASLVVLVQAHGVLRWRIATSLLAGAAIAAIVCAAYALPYLDTQRVVGERTTLEIAQFSATPLSYLASSETNWLYGDVSAEFGGQERRLFPGLITIVLAAAGILFSRRTPSVTVALVSGLVAFDLSLAFEGLLYPLLNAAVSFFQGFRATARFGVFVLFFLGLLAAHGTAGILARFPRKGKPVVVGLAMGLLVEFRVAPLPLDPYPNQAPPIYRLLAAQPPGVVAEFPMPPPDVLPGGEARVAYASTFHWNRLLNGYSGYYPPSYFRRLVGLRDFPSDSAIQRLQREGTRYVVVHASGYKRPQFDDVLLTLAAESRMVELGRFSDGEGDAVLYAMR